MRCGYHLWSFAKDGRPAAVPHRGDVPLSACHTADLSLDRWKVATIGRFLFVAHHPESDLKSQLGSLHDRLLRLSDLLGQEVWSFEQTIDANWKIILQNTVEFDHAFSVHRETFAPLVERPLTIIDYAAPEPHIGYLSVLRQTQPVKPIEKRIAALFALVSDPVERGYRHHLIFPATVIGTTDNRHVAVSTYQPMDAKRTRASYRVFAPAIPNLKPVERMMLASVVGQDAAFIRQLLDEDRVLCESVQRGASNAPRGMPGTLMPGEVLVRRFQETYWRKMDRLPESGSRRAAPIA